MIVKLGSREIGSNKTFLIAEIGNNHNGDFDVAIKMIDLAIDTGVDCVKFQMRNLNEVYRKRTLHKDGEDLGTEYVLDLLQRFELSIEEHRKLAQYCKEKGIIYLCTPWDKKSVDILEEFGVPAYKVASADLTNLPLLDKLCATGKPLIISTGMSTGEEIQITVDFLNKKNANFVLLHCNSTYPAPLHDINLKFMHRLRKCHPLIGYSGHERGTAVSLAAVSIGACVIERHFTLDRTMEGPDHAASLEHAELKQLVTGIREIEIALGSDGQRKISQGEMINRENLGKSLVAAAPLSKGTIISSEHIKIRSPGQGLSPQKYEQLLGRKLQRDLAEEDFFYNSDIKEEVIKPGTYLFKRPWGIPVRYHDFHEYSQIVKPDLFEFHLSYSDMELNLKDFLSGTYSCNFVVHAPELFAGSHLLDLASPDLNYLNNSIREMQRVIDVTRLLKKFFPNTKRPMIVTNIGGFTMDATLPSSIKNEYYARFADSITKLDTDEVEIIPQTMAPFPWHFGGQRYQNLFVQSEEIIYWCKQLNMRMCFDVSHSCLTCNHFGIDFYEFCKQVAPISAHLHLGDASGVNGEGLQVGSGDIDFAKLGNILNKECANASFIPEIWQGHKNGGEGFWIALEKLRGIL